MYKCECGRKFEKSQSYVAHCGHCEIHLGRDPIPRHELTGQERGRGAKTRKTPIELILVKGSKFSIIHLKWRLIEEGLKEWKCEGCGNTEWLGNPIPLELHHKDGDNTNHELDNLALLCPNCHALTDTYCGKNNKKAKRGSTDFTTPAIT